MGGLVFILTHKTGKTGMKSVELQLPDYNILLRSDFILEQSNGQESESVGRNTTMNET